MLPTSSPIILLIVSWDPGILVYCQCLITLYFIKGQNQNWLVKGKKQKPESLASFLSFTTISYGIMVRTETTIVTERQIWKYGLYDQKQRRKTDTDRNQQCLSHLFSLPRFFLSNFNFLSGITPLMLILLKLHKV